VIEVTSSEEGAALRWLAKRGQRVDRPAPLLTALIATRQPLRRRYEVMRSIGYVVLASVCVTGYTMLVGSESTDSDVGYSILIGLQLAMWDRAWGHERKLRASLPSRSPADPWWRVLGGWYIVSLVVAFAGGIALATAIGFTTPARTYAVGWLGLLVLSGLSIGWVLTSVLRGRVFGEDAESLAVERALRTERIYLASPVYAVLPIAMNMVLGGRQPPAAAMPWLVRYIVAVVVLQAISGILHWRRQRRLPPGHYGRPLPEAVEGELGGARPSNRTPPDSASGSTPS
jgi:hypothetical protein